MQMHFLVQGSDEDPNFPEFPEDLYKMFCIISLPCNQMASSHVDPFKFREERTEFIFNHINDFLKSKGIRFKQDMKMQSFDSFRKSFRFKIICSNSQSRSRRTWIIKIIANFRELRIDP